MESSLTATLVGAFQGALSVLLTILSGYLCSYYGLLNRPAIKQLSNLTSTVFLPCLMVVQMGPQLTVSGLTSMWIVPVWGLVSTVVAHGLGYVGKKAFGLPGWTIAAAGRAESNALPLLLIESLQNAGVLDSLKQPGEPVDDFMRRARSMILLNSAVQQTLTFAFGPPLLKLDRDVPKSPTDGDHDVLLPGSHHMSDDLLTIQDSEHVGLFYHSTSNTAETNLRRHLDGLAEVPAAAVPRKWQGTVRLWKRPFQWLNPPLVGATVAFFLGMVPGLHHMILDNDGVLYNSVTQAIKNLGDLFVVFQMFTLGSHLQSLPSTNPQLASSLSTLTIRYILMPSLSLAFVWFTARKGLYMDDPLVWFLIVLIPSGPSAMMLINLAEMLDVDQGPVSGFLTVSYALSPLISFVCSIGLRLVKVIQDR